MGFSRQKPKQSANLATSKGVRCNYLEEARRNTRGAKKASVKQGIKSGCNSNSESRQDQMQAYMASIRSEAVQARRLAEQINNLSQKTPKQTRKQTVMTDSTTIDPGKAEQQRRATDKPRAASVRSSFNPLHPSMELPPEQLIRLLGLESKKIRKHRRKQPAPAQQTTVDPETTTALPPELEPSGSAPANNHASTPRSTHRQREYEQAREQGDSKIRRSLWLPALATGLICGAAASAYLFWMPPQHSTASTVATTPVPNKVNRSPVTAAPGKTVSRTTALATKATAASAMKNDPAWLATTEARGKHLRDEAKQRLEQRLKQAAIQTPSTATAAVSVPQPDTTETDSPAVPQTSSTATVPVSAPQAEATTTDAPDMTTSDAPEVLTTDAPEVITTYAPEVETETAADDGTPAEGVGDPAPNLATEPEDESLQAPAAPGTGDGNAGELNEEQVHAATSEPTELPSDDPGVSIPAVDTSPREGAAESL